MYPSAHNVSHELTLTCNIRPRKVGFWRLGIDFGSLLYQPQSRTPAIWCLTFATSCHYCGKIAIGTISHAQGRTYTRQVYCLVCTDVGLDGAGWMLVQHLITFVKEVWWYYSDSTILYSTSTITKVASLQMQQKIINHGCLLGPEEGLLSLEISN